MQQLEQQMSDIYLGTSLNKPTPRNELTLIIVLQSLEVSTLSLIRTRDPPIYLCD